MHSLLSQVASKIFAPFGYEVRRKSRTGFPPDLSTREIDTILFAGDFTLTSVERMVSLIHAVDYIENNQLEGDIVECGVWKGGSMMVVARTLLENQSSQRELYLYDTFEGMSEPTAEDISHSGQSAIRTIKEEVELTYAPLDLVKNNLSRVGYAEDKSHYVVGKVEDTIPQTIPEKISLLRLDTDWYESTRHELEHLFPRLVPGGILIVDDYGHWQGARKAVDEYIEEKQLKIFLARIDYTGRIAVKL